jgi:hypothetical protein
MAERGSESGIRLVALSESIRDSVGVHPGSGMGRPPRFNASLWRSELTFRWFAWMVFDDGLLALNAKEAPCMYVV